MTFYISSKQGPKAALSMAIISLIDYILTVKAIIKDFISRSRLLLGLQFILIEGQQRLAGWKTEENSSCGSKEWMQAQMLTEVRQGTETSEADRVNSAVS